MMLSERFITGQEMLQKVDGKGAMQSSKVCRTLRQTSPNT